jgi:methanogenic corrinoid protein MtbC1
MVETEWFDLVGISVNHNQTVAEVRAMIMQIRQVCPNERLQVMVGGLIPGNRVQFTQEVGADLLGTDARESQLMALELVTGKAAHVPKRQQRAS